jgi:hypothetical protein
MNELRRTRARGSAMVELALVLALLSPMVASGLRFAYSSYLVHALQDAVADGAEYGSGLAYVNDEAFRSAVRERVLSRSVPRLDSAHVSVEIEPGPGGDPRWIVVAIHGYPLPTPVSTKVLDGKPRARFPYRLRKTL